MAYGYLTAKRAALLSAGALIAGSLALTPAVAQDKAAAPKAAAPAAKAPAAAPAAGQQAAAPAEGNKSAWVKLCEKAQIPHHDAKENKDTVEEKNICLTHHERLDGNTGMVLVSAAIRHIEGQDKQHLMVMVPLGMAIPAGVRAAVYTKEQWEKAAKNEKIDEKTLKPIELKYSLCHPAGCTAETEATKEILESMKTGGGLMVLAMNAAAQPIAFPVPLDGFSEAENGKPVDNAEYAKARGQLMEQIRQRQAQLIEQYRKEQAEKAGATGSTTPPAAGAAPAAAPAAKAAAPADKKK